MPGYQSWDATVRMGQPWRREGDKTDPREFQQKQLVAVPAGSLGSRRKVMAGVQTGRITESDLIIGSGFKG